ncbi:uncharacterized protein LOC141854181 [Brevipalpus obovatus]|uniref:uncharacterized protein LOC141854181 n=1 Tax=Brevipalpus obovatus TaxID=246614 RepID=UPI003D9E4458
MCLLSVSPVVICCSRMSTANRNRNRNRNRTFHGNCFSSSSLLTTVIVTIIIITSIPCSIQQALSDQSSLSSQNSQDFLLGHHHIKCFLHPSENIENIECPDKEKIIINEAYFHTESSRSPLCKLNEPQRGNSVETCYEDEIVMGLNAKCSGRSDCGFNTTDLMAESSCKSSGHIFLNYTCVTHEDFTHFASCNKKIKDKPAGVISSPMYPNNVIGLTDCKWVIVGEPGQTIDVQVLDVNLGPPEIVQPKTWRHPEVSKCNNAFTLTIDAHAYEFCGSNRTSRRSFTTKGNSVKLALKQDTFQGSFRGFLIRYQVKGCANLKDPYKGHIVTRNESHASLRCCEGYVFKDTRTNEKELTCLHNLWNGVVSVCVALHPPTVEVLQYNGELLSEENVKFSTEPNKRESVEQVPRTLFSDSIIPAALMVIFVVIVVILIVSIVKCRGRTPKSHLLKASEASVPLNNPAPVDV